MRRVFVDTNVCLRFLTRDDTAKADKARGLFEAAVRGRDRGLLLEALPLYAERNVDFIDAYHGVFLGRRREVSLATFDRKHFRRFPQVELMEL